MQIPTPQLRRFDIPAAIIKLLRLFTGEVPTR